MKEARKDYNDLFVHLRKGVTIKIKAKHSLKF